MRETTPHIGCSASQQSPNESVDSATPAWHPNAEGKNATTGETGCPLTQYILMGQISPSNYCLVRLKRGSDGSPTTRCCGALAARLGLTG